MDDNDTLCIKFSLADRAPRFGTEPMPPVGGTATERRGALLCEYGWHACLPGAGGKYIGTEAYLVRLSGDVASDGSKIVGSTVETVARLPWTRDDLVAFARACAARATERAAAAYAARAAAAAATYADASAAADAAYAADAAANAAAADAADADAYAYDADAADAAANAAADDERRAQWDWIVARLRENGADLTGVVGA